jgi:hypothetical protein
VSMGVNPTIFRRREADLLTGQPLRGSETVVDLGTVPVPGLFFPSGAAAAAAVAPVRLVKSAVSGLIQLDGDIIPELYTFYKTGAVTKAHLDFVETLAESLANRFGRESRVLEIGGNAGHLMRALRNRGFRYLHVIDPSAENADTNQWRVTRGLFPAGLAGSGMAFDAIVGQHFLEHSDDPVGVLRAARQMLAPGGEIWVEVPDISESALADGGMWLSVVYALHSSYFGRDTLALAANVAGLAVREIQSVNHYGKSLLAVFEQGEEPNSLLARRDCSEIAVVAAIRRYFEKLKYCGAELPTGALCWGAAERCLTVLGGLMAGGFRPGQIIDSNPNLCGLYPSGMSSPVQSPRSMTGPFESVVMLSPLNAREIIASNGRLFSSGTKVYVPSVHEPLGKQQRLEM